MIRKGRKYTVEEILPQIQHPRTRKKIELDGDIVKVSSQRLYTFKTSVKCCCCGLEGMFFVKEKTENDVSFHLNLYAIDEFGEEMLMTKDHIVPRSLGGKDNCSNYQTMCLKCNLEKGNGIQTASYKTKNP